MDFSLNDDQRSMKEMVRKFIEKEVKPGAAERERSFDPKLPLKERYPWDLMKKASKMGLRTLCVPKKYGGQDEDIDMITQVILAEEIGRGGDAFIAILPSSHWKFCHNLGVFLNDEQQDEFFPLIMQDDTFLTATAVTEPDSSTDIHLPYDEPGVAMKTFAYRDGEEYVINGTKCFITGSAYAKLVLVYARTDRTKPLSQAMSAFLVPAGTHGFIIGHVDDMLGERLGGNAELIFEDCRIPARYLVGEENEMFEKRMTGWHITLLTYRAYGLGQAQACYEDTLEYARTRIQGGKPIIEHINIGTELAKMRMWIETSRAFLHKVAWSYDTKHKYDPVMVLLAKAYVDKAHLKVIESAMEVWAAHGAQKELPMEKYLRDAWAKQHGGSMPNLNLYKASKLL